MQPTGYGYREFVQIFLQMLFEPFDLVRIGVSRAGGWSEEKLPFDFAVRRLWQLEGTPNLYFGQSAFAPGRGCTAADCLTARAVCLDIDCGAEGHAKPGFFDTEEQALACVMTAPLAPSCVWATGHGLQVMYRLAEPYEFRMSPDPAAAVKRYKAVAKVLAAMLKADSAVTPEHLFRVPLSVNAKPGLPPVTGRLLHLDSKRAHRWEELEAACRSYDVPEEEMAVVAVPDDGDDGKDGERLSVPYGELPEELRAAVEDRSAPDRSSAMFRVVALLWREGYAESVIEEAVRDHFDVPIRFRGRLDAEIGRCLDKVRKDGGGFATVEAPVAPRNGPRNVPLSDCPELRDDFLAMLKKYCGVAGIPLTERVIRSARFHERLFAEHPAGVVEAPCGSGKSTWALCRIALCAGPGAPCVYVTDTLETLSKAADTLERLNPGLGVGRYHGFDGRQCRELTGKSLTWRDCSPANPKRACRSCRRRDACEYYTREDQLRKPAAVMCHNGLLRLLELEPDKLDGRCVLVDEDLNAFLSAEFGEDELALVREYLSGLRADPGGLLPFTGFAAPCGFSPGPGCASFAGLNYVYRDESGLEALRPVLDTLRKGVAEGFLDPFRHAPGDWDLAEDALLRLLNFFRPGVRGDSSYAYTEKAVSHGGRVRHSYVCKKSRISLGAGLPGGRLWILNASAGLARTPYPEGLPVFRCPDLASDGGLVTLHVVRGNPMRSKRDANAGAALEILRGIAARREGSVHGDVFVAADGGEGEAEKAGAAVREALGGNVRIVALPRGRIRGSNEAGRCTLAVVSPMSLFTSVDDAALSAALAMRRTFPASRLFGKDGRLRMPGGRFGVPAMREHFALSALDELYQALYRSAVRNGRPVEAVAAVPDPEWLSLLWRTVLPGFRLGAAVTVTKGGAVPDGAMAGLHRLISMRPGEEIAKSEIAQLLGYSERTGWKDRKNRARMRLLLEPFFEEVPGNVRKLVRTGRTGA